MPKHADGFVEIKKGVRADDFPLSIIAKQLAFPGTGAMKFLTGALPRSAPTLGKIETYIGIQGQALYRQTHTSCELHGCAFTPATTMMLVGILPDQKSLRNLPNSLLLVMKRVVLGRQKFPAKHLSPPVNKAVVGHGVEFRRLAQFCEFSRFSVSVENERSRRQAHEFHLARGPFSERFRRPPHRLPKCGLGGNRRTCSCAEQQGRRF